MGQVAVIAANGDTHEFITVCAVIRNAEARFFRLRFGSGWDQPKSVQKRVNAQVRSLLVDGSMGPSFPGDLALERRRQARHGLPLPFARGSGQRNTPENGMDLAEEMRTADAAQKPDPFTFYFRQPVERATYTIVLPAGVDVHWDVVALNRIRDDFEIIRKTSAGRVEITLAINDLPANRRAGMLLELQR